MVPQMFSVCPQQIYVSRSPTRTARQCYNVQGIALDTSYEPCDTDAEVSACCQLNHTSPDVCFGTGLCLSTRDEFAGTIWGDGCTDQQGGDTACPHICAGKVDATDYWSLMQCPEQGAWCCRAWGDWTSCCNDTSKAVLLRSEDVTALASSLPTASDDNSAVVGGVVGGVLGAVILFLAHTLVWLFRRTRQLRTQVTTPTPPLVSQWQSQSRSDSQSQSQSYQDYAYKTPIMSAGPAPYRMPLQEADASTKNIPVELHGSFKRSELESSSSTPLYRVRQ